MSEKKYFTQITTTGVDYNLVAVQHNEKLNNYLKYGTPFTNVAMNKLLESNPYTSNVDRDVKEMNTTVYNMGHTWYVTTFLCCEDENEGGEAY